MNKLSKYIFISISMLIVSSFNIFSATNYVSKTGDNISPYTSWSNAANNIQAAINVASSGDLILVNDGIYYPASRIYVTNGVTVKSVNGAEKTIINGNNSSVYFYINENNVINSFTITNSSSDGVYCNYGGTVQNCTISGNSGNGVYCNYGGTVQNCTISKNSAHYSCGVYCYHGGTVQNCIISGNSGSGVNCFSGGIVQNCTISGNLGNGIYCYDGTVQYCTIKGNNGGIYCEDNGSIKNSLIIDNSVSGNGGGIYVSYGGITLANNTIVRNFAGSKGGGIYNDSENVVALYNSIVYGNMAAVDLQVNSNVITHYSCVENGDLSNHCITNDPMFYSEFNFHFTEDSPCINAGINLPNIWDETDLDGNPRVQGGTVDMGCYEGPIPEPGLLIICYLSLIVYYLRKIHF